MKKIILTMIICVFAINAKCQDTEAFKKFKEYSCIYYSLLDSMGKYRSIDTLQWKKFYILQKPYYDSAVRYGLITALELLERRNKRQLEIDSLVMDLKQYKDSLIRLQTKKH